MTAIPTFFVALFDPVRDWAAFALWQSTTILGIVVVFERFLRRSPWQAHLLTTLGILASVLTPTVSLLLAKSGGGLFETESIFVLEKQAAGPASVLGPLILAGGTLFAVFLVFGIVAARRLMFRARPFPDRESQEALLEGAKMMQNVSLPILFTSGEVKSPTVWSWGLHPAVLLPESLSATLSPQERDGIFLHELAHISRWDHWAALATRLCGVLLFWNPLYWAVLRLGDLAADRACDLLVLAREKVPPEIYGEILLRLAAGEKDRPALQFYCQYLSRKELLMKRIDTIFDFAENRNGFSVTRTPLRLTGLLVGALLLTTALAFCQEKKKNATAPTAPAAGARKAETSSLAKLIGVDGLKPYRVDKTVAEFPEKIDLSTPEGAYAAQKQLIVSDRKDKIEQLEKLHFTKIKISERERKGIEQKFDPEWTKKYKEEFIVFEVIPFGEDRAFVFGLRRFDMLYDGNYFQKKDDGFWYNLGNFQEFDPADMADQVEQSVNRLLKEGDIEKSESGPGPLDQKKREKLTKNQLEKPADAPVVSKLEPANGAKDVDAAAVKELCVTFDVDMNTTSFSWCGDGETFPETTDKPKWIDKRTCVLPVKLQPGKSYRLGINAPSFKGFQSEGGVPVEPLTYKFSTKE